METMVSVDPLSSRYVPRAGDLVVGYVEGMTNNIWFLDIGASFNAILPMSLAPWKVEFGAVREHLDVGDAVFVVFKKSTKHTLQWPP